MVTQEYYGLVDVHVVRHFWLNSNEEIQHAVADLIDDVNEIVKSRVIALGGNCLIGYKIDINGFDQKENEVFMIVSATGDAIKVAKQKLTI